MGDQLLNQAARRIEAVNFPERLIGRFSGDEFVVALGNIRSPDQVKAYCQQILQVMREPFTIEENQFSISASIGTALFPDHSTQVGELLKMADMALYQAKSNGRNGYFIFEHLLATQLSRKVAIERELKQALQNQEIHVEFQPLVCIATREIRGAEALIRWNNSVLGTVRPDEFIAIAEHTGLIFGLGQFVLKEAIAFATRVQQNGLHGFKIAVNISPVQFRDPSFLDHLKKAISDYGLAPDTLDLEITEGVLLSASPAVKQTLHELRKLGVDLSMDDFGTGYSSLNYLQQYPFSRLKIDRSFVHNSSNSHESLTLLTAMLSLADQLDIKAVAEGVETEAEHQFLAKHQCAYGQGYLYGKPMRAEQFFELISKTTTL